MNRGSEHLLGSRARGRDGSFIGSVVAADATEMRVDIPDAGVARVPYGDLLREERSELVLRHGRDWYARVAREPPTASAAIQDGRMHDVSVDGQPPLDELQPAIEAGDAPLRSTTATDRGLRSSSVGDARPAPPPEFPVLDVAAQGLGVESSDRIEPGAPGSHRAGVAHAVGRGGASDTGLHYLVGRIARGSDGAVLGYIVACNAESFTIERAHVVPRAKRVPYDQIARMEEGLVALREPARFYESDERARAQFHELAPEQEDERAPMHGEPEPGVHVPVDVPERPR